MAFETLFILTLALFAAFGLFVAVRLLLVAWLWPHSLGVTVIFATDEDAAAAPELLNGARAQFMFSHSTPIFALLLGEQAENEALVAFLNQEGISCFGIDSL